MSNLDRLCHVKNGSALAYSKGGSALIYKGNPPGDVTVRVPWSPQSYTCDTYSQYHELTFSCTGSFTQGQGTVLSKTDGGTETVFKLRITQGPAVFSIVTSCGMDCASSEDPGVTCRVLANQAGVAPQVKSGVTAPRSGSSTTVVNFNASKRLTGVQ